MHNSITIKMYLLTRFGLIGILIILIWSLILKSSYEFAQDDTTAHYLFYDGELAEAHLLDLPIIDDFKIITQTKNDLPNWAIEKLNTQEIKFNHSHYFQIDGEHVYFLPFKSAHEATTTYVLHYFEDQPTELLSWLNLGISLLSGLLLLAVFTTHRTLKSQSNNLHLFIFPYSDKPKKKLKFSEFQAFADALKLSRQAEQEAQTQQRLVSAYLSHEVNTPITQINHALARIHQLDDIPFDALTALEQLAQANNTLLETSRAILALQQIHQQELEEIDIVAELNALATVEAFANLTIKHDFNASLKLTCHRYLLKLLLTQVLKNALQHGEADKLGKKTIQIDITQTSIQFSNVTANHPLHLGHGLGIDLIQQICKKFNWRCYSESTATLFTLTLIFTDKNFALSD